MKKAIIITSILALLGSCSSEPYDVCSCVEYTLPMLEERVANFEEWTMNMDDPKWKVDDPNVMVCDSIMNSLKPELHNKTQEEIDAFFGECINGERYIALINELIDKTFHDLDAP